MARRLPCSQQLKRELRNWSQADLASMIGIDTKTVNQWESGKRISRPYLRHILCEILSWFGVGWGTRTIAALRAK